MAGNDGAPGVDGVSIEQVQNSEHGVSGFLGEIEQSLKARTYRPQADFGELRVCEVSPRST